MEAPEFIATGYYGLAGNNHFSPENRCYEQKFANNNQFTVDDLLDFSKEDEVMSDAFFDNLTGNCSDISTSTVVDSCNSSISGSEPQFSGNNGCRSFADAQFSSELCVPYEDLAELEWLSSFVDDSFSSNDSHINLHHLIPIDTSSSQTRPDSAHHRPVFPSAAAVPGKARSKRSRAPPCDWSSRLLLLQQHTSSPRTPPLRKRETATETPGRTCLHCGSDKTPQWRAGPMGPKTLCNACGVRYKSGRLVPEYRPAASPTFVAAKHSNSHRKVIELRRLKEMQSEQILGQSSIFGGSNGGDYLIHHQTSGSDYRHMA